MRQKLYVLEFQAGDGSWDWFFGYATRAEAKVDEKRYGREKLANGRQRKTRITVWERLR